MASQGWVLVFDLDETLSAVNDSEWIGKLPPFKKAILNRKAIEILKRAIALRRRGQVAAILLLTNNDSDDYIDGIVKRLEAACGSASSSGSSGKPLFDLKAKRNDTVTPRTPDPVNGAGYPLKDVVTVERMMTRLGKSTDQLASRIFFFDDIPNHVMSKEVQPSQYIVMKWVQKVDGKIVSFNDQTNYTAVHEALGITKSTRSASKKTRRLASRARDLRRWQNRLKKESL